MTRVEPTIIVVPQGSEYRAVLKGLNRVAQRKPDAVLPTVMPLPIGPDPVSQRLRLFYQEHQISSNARILLMGLGGSLVPELAIGAIALIETCEFDCNPRLTPLKSASSLLEWANERLQFQGRRVRGVTSTQLISSAREKVEIHQRVGVSVVDMESYSLLQFCYDHELQGSVLRVISDGCTHNVPDINTAISPDGTLHLLPLAMAFLQQPVGAIRLIQGALKGLDVLSQVTQQLFEPS